MTITAEDRAAIAELLATHGHLIDAGELDRLDEVLTVDAVYDVSDLGAPPLVGTAAIVEAALKLGPGNPVGHHVTNIVVTPDGADRVRCRSKGIGVNADGTTGSATYHDIVERRPEGWRISHRTVIAHREPLGAE